MVVREPRIQPPALDAYSDMPLFNTKAVVNQTRVPAPTLRAWERRYGILTPHRGENDYRLYSERDMIIITWLRDRVESGLTISQAIALLRSLEPGRPGGRGHMAQLAPDMEPAEALGAHTNGQNGQSPEAADFGAHTVYAPAEQPYRFSLDDLSALLIRQFSALDEYSASRTIAQALAIYPVEDVCLSLFTPALMEIGRRWAEGTVTVTVEHFGSAVIRAQLESLFRSAGADETGPLALVACAPGEQHELGPLMLALFLRRVGLRVAYLGQNIEPESLLVSVNACQPACVALSATTTPHALALIEANQRLQQLDVCPSIFFGGQAFTGAPELIKRAPGVYLDMNACDAAHEIKRRLARVA